MKIISQYIAPWAMAKEPFPLHLIWEFDGSFDHIKIQLPQNFEVKELLNVSKYEFQENKIIFAREHLLSTN